MSPQLYTSRMVRRFFSAGRPMIASLSTERSIPMAHGIEDIVAALWDRRDRRTLDERLATNPRLSHRPMRQLRLRRMREAGILVDESVDEGQAWYRHLGSQLSSLPLVDQIELRNACPFTCLFCPRGLGQRKRPVGHLD